MSCCLPCAENPYLLEILANVKAELDNLTDQNVITPKQDPIDWVSNLVVTMRKNGDLRVCLDPLCLNKSSQSRTFPFTCVGRYST